MFKRILLASDLSGASRPAFKLAVRLARLHKATLVLCHAYQPMAALAMAPRADRLRKEVREAQLKSATRRLESMEAVARRAHVKASAMVVKGRPAGAILRTAARAEADLLVVGSRGRTGVKRLLLGSVAEAVVRGAPCPVLVVRGTKRRS